MFNFGAVNLPLATAEIVTVVRAYDQSFKLANTGPVVGTISQDRLTGISGTIGAKPELTDFRSHVTDSDGKTRTFQGELWQNCEMSPVIGATGLLESLNATSQVAQEQTFYVNTTVDIDGFAPLVFKTVASGPDAADSVAEDFLAQYDKLLGNEFEFPKVKSVDFDIKLRDTWLMSTLESVRVDSGPARAGETLRVVLTLSNYLAAPTEQVVEVPIPAQAAGETLTLFFGDASSADALDRGASRHDLSSLADVVNYLRQSHSGGALYVKLLRSVSGLRVGGESLPALPPSVQALYLSPKNVSTGSAITQTTLWETSVPVPGEFSGHYNLSVPVLP
jgi:hypothetical protein